MSKRNHFIIVGRVSQEIANGIVQQFGDGGQGEYGPLISKPGRVIQARVGSYGDGEANAELFVAGKLPDHPIEQILTTADKYSIAEQLDGANVTLVGSISGINTSNRALSIAFLAEALKKDYGVRKIKLIAPALPFMRNDRQFSKKEKDGSVTEQFNAVACKCYAKILHRAGVDFVTGFEPHSRDGVKIYRKIFGKNHVSFVNMGRFFADTIANEYGPVSDNTQPLLMVGSPDGMNKANDYGIARAKSLASELYASSPLEIYDSAKSFRARPYMFGIHKERINASETAIVDFHGDVAGKICFIVDDIIAGGSTTLLAAHELKKRGATEVIAIATHGVLVGDAIRKLAESPSIDRVLLTDTIPGVTEKLDASFKKHKKNFVAQTVSPLVNAEIARGFHL